MHAHHRLGDAADKRWHSATDMLQWQRQRKAAIIALAVDDDARKYMDMPVRQIILDDEFWFDCEDLLQLLQPIAEGIDRMQSDTEPVSIVFHVFSEWENLFGNDKSMSAPQRASKAQRSMPRAGSQVDAGADDEDEEETKSQVELLDVTGLDDPEPVPVGLRRMRRDTWSVLPQFLVDRVQKRWDLISDFVHSAAYAVDARFRDAPLGISFLDEAEKYFQCCVVVCLADCTSFG